MNTTVKAVNNQMACMKAIEKTKSKSLGLIIGSKIVGAPKEEEMFCKTEYILQCMGLKLNK